MAENGSPPAAGMRAGELGEIIGEIRARVRARHPQGTAGSIQLPDLMPLLHARDAAEAKVASIGTVNPRPPGFKNNLIQAFKGAVARALGWHVREQVEFNRGIMGCVQSTLEALNESNRALGSLAAQMEDLKTFKAPESLAGQIALFQSEAQQMKDLREHWTIWRGEWEGKLTHTEISVLRGIAELQGAFQHRVTLLEATFREQVKMQHGNFELTAQQAAAGQEKAMRAFRDQLDHQMNELQSRFWADLEKVRGEYESLIHSELRLLRQRSTVRAPDAAPPPTAPAPQLPADPQIDWSKFAEKFRGSEEHVIANQRFYAGRFAGLRNVLDIGCGRGELLQVFRDADIPAKGVDLSEENIALCRSKGLEAEHADAFEYLEQLADGSLGGVTCMQVVEHLRHPRIVELVNLVHAKLRPGGLVAMETPNPECLAIFATHFLLDPTHKRPLPPALLAFYLEEAGFGNLETVRLYPAAETFPSLQELPEGVRDRFFGAQDYVIFGRKLL